MSRQLHAAAAPVESCSRTCHQLRVGAIFSCNQRPQRENSQSIEDAEGAVGAVLPPGKRERIGASLALAVDVDTGNLIGKHVDQVPNRRRVGVLRENGGLLPEG